MSAVYRRLKHLLPVGLKDAAKKRLGRVWQGYMARQTPWMRSALQNLLFERRLARVVRQAQAQFDAVQPQRELKLNLGSGAAVKAGWVNVDLFDQSYLDQRTLAGATCIAYDLRRPLPLAAGSCAHIYSSHFLEHLQAAEGLALLQECYRLLATGGVLRLAIPDFAAVFAAYVEGDDAYFDLLALPRRMPHTPPQVLSRIDHLNYAVYQHGEHKCLYDADKLMAALRYAGFTQITQTGYDPAVDPEDAIRRKYSLYMNAVK